MKSTELRIGNYYKDIDNELSELSGFELYQMTVKENTDNLGINEYQPILLTEVWLLKLGFEKHKILGSYNIGMFRFHSQRPFQSAEKFNLVTELYYCEKPILVSGGVKEVHQLQNVYYALIGKELTIKVEA